MKKTVYSGQPQGLIVPAWKAPVIRVSSLEDLVFLGRENLEFMADFWVTTARWNDADGTPQEKMQKVRLLRNLTRQAKKRPPLPQFRRYDWTKIGEHLVRAHVNGDMRPFWDPVCVTGLRRLRPPGARP